MPSSTPPILDVVAVEVMPGFNLKLTFENGEVRRFNMASFLVSAKGVFIPLRRQDVFAQAFVANGTVCWPGNVDLDPELLYSQSTVISDEALEEYYPRDPEWEAMPDVGLEVWPPYEADTAAWHRLRPKPC